MTGLVTCSEAVNLMNKMEEALWSGSSDVSGSALTRVVVTNRKGKGRYKKHREKKSGW